MADFERFLEAAHGHGMRVITDLVVNHTSRPAPVVPGRAPRARLAPTATTTSGATPTSSTGTPASSSSTPSAPTGRGIRWPRPYYWHRFFRHQPDLNFDNPAGPPRAARRHALLAGQGPRRLPLRRRALPLRARGHQLREPARDARLPAGGPRARSTREYQGRILLAEANQWPADVRPYFGDGDEFHMAFHFPLMPRIFMAVRHGDRRPITDIFAHTPEIPPDLPVVPLPAQPRRADARDGDRRGAPAHVPRVRLRPAHAAQPRHPAPPRPAAGQRPAARSSCCTSLLFTLPGSPILYYGDEIGMGDNIYLGDRNGVRTPMQWTGDRNAGFSRADTARLYLPLIVDPVYGYQAINVEAQQRTPSSLLNWMKRLIAVRKKTRVFGRGTLALPPPGQRERARPRARARGRDGARGAQPRRLGPAGGARPARLARAHAGRDARRHAASPPIGAQPYFLSLAPYGYYWFRLQPPAARPAALWHRGRSTLIPPRSSRCSRAPAAPISRAS